MSPVGLDQAFYTTIQIACFGNTEANAVFTPDYLTNKSDVHPAKQSFQKPYPNHTSPDLFIFW